MSRSVILDLPWPPSINRYWRRAGTHIHISNEGRSYRQIVAYIALGKDGFGKQRVAVDIDAFPPDARRRDIDNIQKALLDALQHGQLFDDDSQVKRLQTTMLEQRKPGMVRVTVTEH